MNVIKTKLPGVVIIEPTVFGDHRGFFVESFSEERYKAQAGLELACVQDKHPRAIHGVLRGRH
jgi:dTDP-4-dehydrorhamnose 3,5-epimerase